MRVIGWLGLTEKQREFSFHARGQIAAYVDTVNVSESDFRCAVALVLRTASELLLLTNVIYGQLVNRIQYFDMRMQRRKCIYITTDSEHSFNLSGLIRAVGAKNSFSGI